MADVCALARGGALSPLSPNESRKRVRGSSAGDCASTFFKRHRTGQSFARRLLHLRGLAVDTRQAEELVRLIDQFPPVMDKVSAPASDLAAPWSVNYGRKIKTQCANRLEGKPCG